MKKVTEFFDEFWLHGVFLLSFMGMIGSLYMSEVEKLPPCPFCWWQRIWLYPLVFIAAIGVATKDKFAKYYVITLSVIGSLFSIYQNLLQIGVFEESEACVAGGTSCATPTIFLRLGSIEFSLEFGALIAFLLIDALSLIYIIRTRKK